MDKFNSKIKEKRLGLNIIINLQYLLIIASLILTPFMLYNFYPILLNIIGYLTAFIILYITSDEI